MLYAITYPSIQVDSENAFVLVPGGPGGSVLEHPIEELTSLELVNELKRPVIMFDPRGTGNESRLNCSLQAEPLSLDIDLLDIRSCLREIGDDVLHYSVNAIVNDLEVLRKALGFKQLDLFGVSYGTLISQAYGVLYPDSVRSMILDSPLPMRYQDLYEVRHHAAYARIHAAKNKDNPDFTPRKFKNQVKTVLRRLRWNRALREDLKMDPRLLFHMYRFTSDSFAGAIAAAANEKNYTGLKEIAKELEPSVSPLRNFSAAMSVSTICNSMVDLVPWDVDDGLLERFGKLVYDVLHKVGLQDFSPFYMTEGFESLAKYCPAMPFRQLRGEGLPLDKAPQAEIPTLVLAGELDSVTPMEDVEDLDAVFKRNVAVVKGADHVVSLHPCGQLLFLEFAIDGSVENLSACE
ncbi:Prolyl aminopeptidase (S33) [Gracilaria domingensis]|nr:Prolyl aminopeptidase (S33) [Gracilaria domingensis]